jgi:hypothetical protein
MKKWLTVALAVSLISLGGWADVSRGTGDPASASLDVTVNWSAYNWIILYIPAGDMSVDLGTITPDLYDPETGTWTPLTDNGGPRTVMVITNDSDGFQLQISGSLSTYPSDHPNPSGILNRLTITSTDLGVTDAALSSTITYTGSQGLFLADDIAYEFTPSFDDTAGSYSVLVTYTATTQ